jgi:hypothetical protein
MDSKSGESWLLGLGTVSTGHAQVFRSGMSAKRIASGALGKHPFVAGKAKWKSRRIACRQLRVEIAAAKGV